MKTRAKIILACCVGFLVAAQAFAAAKQPDPSVEIKRSPLTQHQVRSVLQGSGPQLYRDLCASCHGLDGQGNVTAARALGAPLPDLTRLKETGISSQQQYTG